MTPTISYDADSDPPPADAPRLYTFQASGDAHRPTRLVVGEQPDADACMVDGAWLSCSEWSEVRR